MANTNNYANLLGTIAPAGSDPQAKNPAVDELLNQQRLQQGQIAAYEAKMKPLTGSEFGMQALEGLMADRNADKVQRAAAFQAVNPGVEASIGANGEISLTAKPGSDLGFKYPVFSQQTSGQRAFGSQARQNDILGNFESQFSKIQAMTDPGEIATAYSTLQAASASLLDERRTSLRAQIGGAMGLTDLEAQMQADKVADQAFYDQYYNGQNLGPTDESLANISRYNQLRGQVDQEVTQKLQTDGQLNLVESQMKSLGMLVNAKLNKAFSGEAETDAAAMNLVGQDGIDAVFIARGIDPKSAPATERQVVAAQLFSGQSNATRQSMEIGLAPSEQVATLAATGTGDIKIQAARVLDARTGSKEISKQIMDAYAAFDQTVAPTLSKEQQDTLKVPATVTSAKEKAAAQEQIKVLKMGMVLNNLKTMREQGFANNAQSWAKPQSPLLEEVPTIIEDLLAKDAKSTVSIDQIAQRMDWSGNNLQAKIDALSEYINSQANSLPDNKFFGVPMLYANPEMSKRFVQTLAVKARTNINFTPSGNLLPTMGSDIYGRDRSFRERQVEEANRAAGVTR